ncbi:hypothetical protein CR969_01880 [Candidatus Saccharibacteria bacterium]|nr:MAG: hypothetical protein CR969_01880 [Candidatus Saccharibacteria bacterium]
MAAKKIKQSKTSKSRKLLAKSLGRKTKKIQKSTIRHAHRFIVKRLDRLSDVRRSVIGWVVLLLLLVSIGGFQWMMFRDAYTQDAPAAGGTFSEGVLGPVDNLNPIFARTSAEKSAAKLLFASLYGYDNTGNLKGDLAESTAINKKETEYTVTLKDDLKWSDGKPLTAEDVLFTVNLLKDPRTRAEISGWRSIKAELIDQKTIKFTLKNPYAPFMHALSFPVLPKHILAEVGPSKIREYKFSKRPVGSGPFSFRLLQNDNADGSKKIVHMVSNPNYHRGTTKLERFQLYAYPTRGDITKGLKTNEILATSELIYEDLPEELQAKTGVVSDNLSGGVYALFNVKSEVVKSAKIRQALALSVGRGEIRSKLSWSTSPLNGPIISDQVSGKLAQFPKKDLARAGKILDSLGWKKSGEFRRKGSKELTLSVVTIKGSEYEKVTQELADIWTKQLGVKVEVRIVDPLDSNQDVLQSVLQPRNYDVLVYEFALGGDPDVFAFWHSSQTTRNGLNFSNYSNPVADDALSSGRAKSDVKQRTESYKFFVKQWVKDLPAIPLYRSKIEYVQSYNVDTLRSGVKLVSPDDRYNSVLYWSVNNAGVVELVDTLA